MRRDTSLRILLGAALAAAVALPAREAAAQIGYRVYEWETPMTGWSEPTIQNYVVPKSDQPYEHFGSSATREGMSSHTLEMEYGLTDRVTASVYADFESAHDAGFHYVGARGNVRYRFSNRYQRLFNPALYVEYYVPRGKYEGSNTLETRLILERDAADFRLDLNPILAKSFADTATRVQAELNTGLYYRRFYGVQPGVELFSDLGPFGASPSFREQKQVLFPTVNLRFANAFTWNLGVGVGLTKPSDKLTLRSIFSYQFQTVRPSHQAN